MQITLTAPYGMKMKLELPEEKVSDFMRMVFLYGSKAEPEGAQTAGEDLRAATGHTNSPKGKARREERTLDGSDTSKPEAAVIEPAFQGKPKGYIGFLAIRCESCGEIRSFCTKSFISKSYCKCGHATKLRGLKPLVLECKCGRKYRYQTNVDEECFDLACFNCGNPVDLKLNKHGDAYVTISDA